MTKIKSADILPGDVVKFEFGDYDNWVTARVEQVEYFDADTNSHYRQKLVWHFLAEEANFPQPKHYTQYTCYGDPNEYIDLIERK